jgi:hypothetical protein
MIRSMCNLLNLLMPTTARLSQAHVEFILFSYKFYKTKLNNAFRISLKEIREKYFDSY